MKAHTLFWNYFVFVGNSDYGPTLNLFLSFKKWVMQESTSHLKRSIENKDRMISVLSEKINSHLLLFDSIEKEVFYIKQIMDKVQNIVKNKEEVGKLFFN